MIPLPATSTSEKTPPSRDQVERRIRDLLAAWHGSPLGKNIVCHRVAEAQSALTRPVPDGLDGRLAAALARVGIARLYTHQHEAAVLAKAGHDLVVATPTSSGKTLCYNLPVLDELLADPRARALYLFPTKALARDQVEELRALVAALPGGGDDLGVAVYDGDTPPDQRRAARRRARVLVTNPEMLHSGILPHHTTWSELFAGLRVVVVDEVHTYRGVFGGHVANVLRRLARVAAHHGASPRYIATSATIANPGDLCARLFGRPVRAITESGAPRGERHFVVYNPPLVDPAVGLRESYLGAACLLARDLARSGLGTLVFGRSRLAVEILLRQLREVLPGPPDEPRERGEERIRAYRGGYLPERRRSVERALRAGETDLVVATSALELGIDIGSLDAVVVAGWPGSRAATWQRAGRAGRRLAPSLAVLVASSEPVDQYVASDPEYLFGRAPEHARVDPDNVAILVPHVKCAAFELPFSSGQGFGPHDAEETAGVLGVMAEAGVLHRSPGGAFHYVDDAYPATEVHLRGGLDENFLVVDPAGEVIAEVDYDDAPQVLHDKAIYQLEGRPYQVLRLDHENRKAYVDPVRIDYYTDAMTQTKVRVLEVAERDGAAHHGEVHVLTRVVGFKKIKLHTQENIGYGEVSQPDRERHTRAMWLSPDRAAVAALGLSSAEVAEAALGLAHALHTAAALLLMSDPRDLGRAVGDEASGWFAVSGRSSRGPYSAQGGAQALLARGAPTIFLFDRYAGGTGLAERLFEERAVLLARTARIVSGCACERGCPGCIGPGAHRGARGAALSLLSVLGADAAAVGGAG
jgi:DEAD/DEAH box helicase domain-containing protein